MPRSLIAAAGLVLLTACGDSRCTLKPQPGPCEALIKGVYFDAQLGRCATFDWGGCDGVRPFATMSECQAACE